MIYLRFNLSLSWLLITTNLFFLMFFCQLISSSSNFNHRALTIVKSIDNYLCQNYVFTCFFRQRYHQSFSQQHTDNCKSLLILRSCLHYDIDSMHVCDQSTISQTKTYLADELPTYCFTSSTHGTLSAQHLRSIAQPRMIINRQKMIVFLLLISFFIRMRTCCNEQVIDTNASFLVK